MATGKQIPHNTLPLPKAPLRRCFLLNDERMDRFTLIWLDGSALKNSLDALQTKSLLRRINNDHCLFFDKPGAFLFEIEKIKNADRKILAVMSGTFASEILSETQEHIPTIIIFCRNYQKYSCLRNKYPNVTHICTNYEALQNSIECELPSLKFNLFSNQTLKSIRFLTPSYSLDIRSPYFSYISFIEILKQMPQTIQAKEIMLNKCKDYYRYDKKMLKDIDKFRDEYTENKAIDWYTEESFVFRLINRAFKTEDVVLWYLFRFYVIDLCAQLQKVHQEQMIETSFTVYRGQSCMPSNELELFKSNIGCSISANGFWSSSRDKDIARQFINDASDTEDFKVVFFEISVDGSSLKNAVFVDIEKYTRIMGEGEILFNIGSVFKIQSVVHDSDLGAWRIMMEATDDFTQQMKEQIDMMKKKYGGDDINMIFGRFLFDMKHYSKAECYFQMMLHVLPESDKDRPLIYDYIGDINMGKTYWNEAFRNFNLAYDIKKKLRWGDSDIAVTLNNFGRYYQAIGDNTQALQCYKKASLYNNNPYNMSIAQQNLGMIHTLNEEYHNGLTSCTEAHDMLQQLCPTAHAEIILCLITIGNIHLAQKNYGVAEDYYSTAFDLSERVLHIGDRLRNNCIKALADLYNKQETKLRAIEFCLYWLSEYEQHLSSDHTNIASILMKIAELYEDSNSQKICALIRALHILETQVDREYATMVDCLMFLAEYHQKQTEDEKALQYYDRAFEIQIKIYPKEHPLLLKTKYLVATIEDKV